MAILSPALGPFERRLHDLVPHHVSQDNVFIKLESDGEDSPSPTFLCTECPWSAGDPRHLANHFRTLHLPFLCLISGCSYRCTSQDSLDRHRHTIHGMLCPDKSCHEILFSMSELQHHIDSYHALGDDTARFPCPFPACGENFQYYRTLLEHYDGLHPLYLYQEGKKAPYKCPFCAKRYTNERYTAPHVRSHLANRWAPNALERDFDQSPLIGESRAMDQSPTKPLGSTTERPHRDDSLMPEDEDDYPTTVIDGRVFIDDELVLASPIWGDQGTARVPSSPFQDVSAIRSARMEIGYVLGPQSKARSTDYTDDMDDECPEAFALEDHETYQTPKDEIIKTYGFLDSDLGQEIFGWMLQILKLSAWIGVGEIKDPWTYLLDPQQRFRALQQSHDINIEQDNDRILSILHSSTLTELIHAWAGFKLIAFQLRPSGVPHIISARTILLEILRYCTALELLIATGCPIAIANGCGIPNLLRQPPQDRSLIKPGTSIDVLIGALVQRVKCRAVHERWVDFTNVLILKETKAYILDLKRIARAMYPLDQHGEEWYAYRLDRD